MAMYMNAYLLLGPSNDQNMNVGQRMDFLGPCNTRNGNVPECVSPFRTVK